MSTLEREVRRLRAAGWAYKQIAAQLGVSYNRVWRAASDDHRERARKSSRNWKRRQRSGEVAA